METTAVAPRRTMAVRLSFLGPAFVAAIAYVDPGNVATNLTAGARYGYLLVWVVVSANLMAALVQFLSAKLGLATGRSLPELLGDRMRRGPRIAFWAQAELVAMATDLAEVVGGAIALHLLFGVPQLWGGVITAVASMVLLATRDVHGQQTFERVVMVFLGVIAAGFLFGLVLDPPDPLAAAEGLVPRFEGTDSVLVAAGLLGATVMPHAVYLHSSLSRDRFGASDDAAVRTGRIRDTRWDIALAMGLAGLVNLGMLLLAATSLSGRTDTETLQGAHAAIAQTLGPVAAAAFGLGLLASGLASTSVGVYAGAAIMQGLLHRHIPMLLRRVITLAPALVVLATGIEGTWALVISQVLLSFGIPFALIPLVRLTADRRLMGADVNRSATTAGAVLVAVAVITLNVALIYLTVTG